MIKIIKAIQKMLSLIFSKKKDSINFDKPEVILFEEENFYIDNQEYEITDILTIYYGVTSTEHRCYIKLDTIEKLDFLTHKSYEVLDIDTFLESMNRFNIHVIPSLQYGIYIAKGYALTIFYNCLLHEKYLIKFWTDKDTIFCSYLRSNGEFYNKLNEIEDINLKAYLETPEKCMHNKMENIQNNILFEIKVLDKHLTLGRGYGVYPIVNNEIIFESIFYSFDEKDIKNKIIQLFDQYK